MRARHRILRADLQVPNPAAPARAGSQQRFEASWLVDDKGADRARHVQRVDFVRDAGGHVLDRVHSFEGAAVVGFALLQFAV